ncbi:MAG: hypothetical protein KDI06_22910 [Calditrichaeota bacterium]|nr:hypothetical protein [Calditrichota bacterium]
MKEEMSCPYPLTEFYQKQTSQPPRFFQIPPQALPTFFAELLWHDQDMTPTLEKFHGEKLSLNLIGRILRDNVLLREVTLVTPENLAVEFGAIHINLQCFPEEARELILACHRPLGTILADFALPHFGHPEQFFTVRADALMAETLSIPVGEILYGRTNCIRNDREEPMVNVVEIIPPKPKVS